MREAINDKTRFGAGFSAVIRDRINVAGSRIELPTLGLWILRSNHLSYPAVSFHKSREN